MGATIEDPDSPDGYEELEGGIVLVEIKINSDSESSSDEENSKHVQFVSEVNRSILFLNIINEMQSMIDRVLALNEIIKNFENQQQHLPDVKNSIKKLLQDYNQLLRKLNEYLRIH